MGPCPLVLQPQVHLHRATTRTTAQRKLFAWSRTLAIAAALVALAGSCRSSAAGPTGGAAATNYAVVTDVADGDTITVAVDGHHFTIRLIGIDTPEVGHHGTEEECYGAEASAAVKAWLPVGTPVLLTRDSELHDIYDRTLAYVYLLEPGGTQDAIMVNLLLAQQGYAEPLSIAPNLTHADLFASAAQTARHSGRGLWGACGAAGDG